MGASDEEENEREDRDDEVRFGAFARARSQIERR